MFVVKNGRPLTVAVPDSHKGVAEVQVGVAVCDRFAFLDGIAYQSKDPERGAEVGLRMRP